MVKKCLGFVNYLLIISILLLSILNYTNLSCTKFHSININVLLIILEMISIIICYFYQEKIEKDNLYGKTIKEITNIVKDDHKKQSIQNSRDQGRLSLIIMTAVSALLVFYWAIISRNVWTFLLSVSVLWIAYIYADYLPHSISYSKHYDSLFIKDDETAESIRGLARIYSKEYRNYNGFLDGKSARELQNFDYNENDQHQDKCIKSIFFMKLDSMIYPMIIYSVVILFFNIILVLPCVIESSIAVMITDLNVNTDTVFSIILLILNIVFGTINFETNNLLYDNVNIANKIYDSVINSDKKERYQVYCDIKNNDYRRHFDMVFARGVFVFCSTFIDQDKGIDQIDLNYRMLYIHRYITHRPRFFSTFWFSLIILICLILTWRIKTYIAFILIVTHLIFSFIYYKFFLADIGKKKIIKEIKKLNKIK